LTPAATADLAMPGAFWRPRFEPTRTRRLAMTATHTPTTSTPEKLNELDEQRIGAFADVLFGNALGTVELVITSMGRELGCYTALRGEAGLTAQALAERCGIDTRYAREWLEHQAVAGVLTVTGGNTADTHRYSLPEEHAIALLDEEHPAYVGALADLPPVIARTLGAVVEAYRTGSGVPFADYGLHAAQAGMTRPMFATSLTSEWIPALPDVQALIDAGGPVRIADFGCGEGWAGIYLAEAHDNVTVDGFDLDDASIARAREHAAARGVADRVRFQLRDVAEVEGRYDLVMCCEVIHDLPNPVEALTAMRRAAGADGAVLVIDEKAAEEFTASGDPIERLLYGFSILHCLPVGRVAEDSAETGTVMRPATFRRYARDAGFSDVEELPIEHDMFRFYRPVG
jgi:SAM-dependent methyltransferase